MKLSEKVTISHSFHIPDTEPSVKEDIQTINPLLFFHLNALEHPKSIFCNLLWRINVPLNKY